MGLPSQWGRLGKTLLLPHVFSLAQATHASPVGGSAMVKVAAPVCPVVHLLSWEPLLADCWHCPDGAS